MPPQGVSICARWAPSFPVFFFNDTATPEIYTLSLHDALPIRWVLVRDPAGIRKPQAFLCTDLNRSEEHTSELLSQFHLVCRLLLAKKKKLLLEALDSDVNRSKVNGTMGLLRQAEDRQAEAQAELETAIALDRNNACVF